MQRVNLLPGLSYVAQPNPQTPRVLNRDAQEPDPTWRMVDSNGHGHFAMEIPGTCTYPTMFWDVEPCTMGHGDDCTSEGSWRCLQCNEIMMPSKRPAQPIYEEVQTRYTLRLISAHGSGVVIETYDLHSREMGELGAVAVDAIRARLTENNIRPVEQTFESR